MDTLIPPWFRNLLIAALVAWLAYQLFDYGRDVQAKACGLDQTTAALATSEDRRADEGATTNARTEAADDHIKAIQTLVEQRNAADRTAERLRSQLAQTMRVAQCGAASDPAAERSRQAVAALGAVFAACEAEYRAVAAEAQQRYDTGIHTQREYGALTAADAAASGGAPASFSFPVSAASND